MNTEHTPQVGDVWSTETERYNIIGIHERQIWWKHPGLGIYGNCNFSRFFSNPHPSLIERNGKRGEELWQEWTYLECPQYRKDALHKAWDEYVETMDADGSWQDNESYRLVGHRRYRITDRKREPARPEFKLFEIEWKMYACLSSEQTGTIGIESGLLMDDHRIIGYTDDPDWITEYLGLQSLDIYVPDDVPPYKTQLCDHTGNRKYAIGRLDS